MALAFWLGLPAAWAHSLVTRWAAEVGATDVLPDYPRPQLVRERWQNLNGWWDYALVPQGQSTPGPMTNQIRVPFPLESSLSGAGRPLDEHTTLWYRRRFTLPPDWQGQTILLHFGAVDWATKVFVNGRPLGGHHGGYDAFSLDITAGLKGAGENELLVAVTDPPEGDQPRGKHSRKPEGAFYSPSSGIWQTVWLEPLPARHITGLNLVPDLASAALRASVSVNTPAAEAQVEVVATFAGREVGRATAVPGAELKVPLREVHPWSPADPALYDLAITLRQGSEVLERVRSYFGLRELRLGRDEAGYNRLWLNGQALFQMGVLDQGYWPDGLYTAPTDEALRFDLQTAKRLGFNLVRKHVKIEAERWYYWADRLGMLVWQDMPSGNNTSEAARRQFEMELHRVVEQKANHPCIVMWVLFNEGWGQFETERLVRRLKVADPARLIDSASGWTDLKVGDVIDLHSYPDPMAPAAELSRAGVLG
ncbi:MAG TPA: glycoside hydrolase family 2 TIM barrel-domain containing protein, partial [Bacillota bacterium]|nr:glycoside hydrolase family 2 TIM barrel-domain containing protein [Bacillota bacterium]